MCVEFRVPGPGEPHAENEQVTVAPLQAGDVRFEVLVAGTGKRGSFPAHGPSLTWELADMRRNNAKRKLRIQAEEDAERDACAPGRAILERLTDTDSPPVTGAPTSDTGLYGASPWRRADSRGTRQTS